MKILKVLPLFLVLSCGSAKLDQSVTLKKTEVQQWDRSLLEVPKSPSDLEGIPKLITAKDVQFSSAAQVESLMAYLASDKLKGRETGSLGIERAADYIIDFFRKHNVSPYFNSYQDTLSNIEKKAYNIVGFIEGKDADLKDEFVIIGAHYDHIGIVRPKGDDAIANGANDNASGTATVMELARYFAANRTNKRSVVFTLFSAEEKGLLGSQHLAKKLKDKNIDLYTMLNFEMVGVPMKDKDHLMFISGYEKSNLAEVINGYTNEKLIGFLPTAKQMSLFRRSDNYPFHSEFEVPSHTFCSFDFTNYDYYHHVDDENDIIDFVHMARVVNKSIPVFEKIINSPNKEIKYN